MNNTTSLTKLHHEMIKLRERAEKAEAELQKLREQKHSRGNNHPYYVYVKRIIRKVNEEGYAAPVATKQSQSDSLAVPAPSVPKEWREKLLAGFPLLDEEGLCQEKHHCEWTLLQDRKRLHALLQSAEGYSSQAHNEVRHD